MEILPIKDRIMFTKHLLPFLNTSLSSNTHLIFLWIRTDMLCYQQRFIRIQRISRHSSWTRSPRFTSTLSSLLEARRNHSTDNCRILVQRSNKEMESPQVRIVSPFSRSDLSPPLNPLMLINWSFRRGTTILCDERFSLWRMFSLVSWFVFVIDCKHATLMQTTHTVSI